MNASNLISRRKAVAFGAASAGFTFLPARVLGRGGMIPPSDKLNIGFIGLGTFGRTQLRQLASQNIAALCDVDWRETGRPFSAAEVVKQYPAAKRFDDWRVMLEKMDKSLDAVVVSSTDHTHAHAAIAAMKMGKHVYCEKPLAQSIHDVRAMMAAEKKYPKAITQTGIQGHASEDCRSMVEWIRDGAIGDVRECHIYEHEVSRPGYYDGIGHVHDDVAIPPEVKWDLWVGPAPYRPFNPMYLPIRWRSWLDFGTGKLGDHGPHYIDPIYWALDLGMPETIEADTDREWDTLGKSQMFPQASVVRYTFPARGKLLSTTLTWHHGPDMPPLPKGWKAEEKPPAGGGIVVGSKGAIVFGPLYASKPGEIQQLKLIPEELNRDYKRPEKTLPRPASHWLEWVECAKAGKPASANFAYGGNITQIALLGDVAIRNKGKTLSYDAKRGKFTDTAANELFQRHNRKGWELPR
jgi:predicted dehydrogenase